ncbi:MAG: hypothetical protein WAK17_14700 [Candidatus Nitrosopolaris sp.]|jgi:hypothetical protein
MPLRDLENAEVTCLVDNNVDVLLPNTQLAHRPSLAQKWFEQPLLAEHGFSVILKLEINGTEHRGKPGVSYNFYLALRFDCKVYRIFYTFFRSDSV